MRKYIAVYLGSLFLALAVTPLVIVLARRLGAVDHPGVRTVHKEPIPRIGGIVIFFCSMAMLVTVLFLDNAIGALFRQIRIPLMVLMAAATCMFAVGLYDDLRRTRALYKLIAQVICAMVLCAVGVRIQIIHVADWWTIDLGVMSWPMTILWICGVTNAVNLSDGLDGLAAGISAIACGVIAVLAVYTGQVVLAVMMLAMLGSLTGFLYFNFNPAKVFMGDCGSLFLGFTIASVSVMAAAKSHALVGLTLPALALGVPIFDTFFSMLRRFLERRSMFAPDRSHFHHRLLDLGLHQKHVVLTIYTITAAAAGLGMFMIITRDISTVLIFVSLLILLVLVFRGVGLVRFRHSLQRLKGKYQLSVQEKQDNRNFEHLQLEFRNAVDFDQWWSCVCRAAEKMDFSGIHIPVTNRDGSCNVLSWQKENFAGSSAIKSIIPIRDRRSDEKLEVTLNIKVNGSLESASRRATLFSRLMEENGIHTI